MGSVTSFFGLTEISNKRAKGWWSNNVKAARKEMKESVRRYKLRQSPANLQKMEEVKEKYQTAISEAKLKQYKSNTKFLNESKDSTQFWHRYNKALGKKTNNIVEPIYDTESGQHIFDDKKISEKPQKSHTEKIGKNEFDLQFKHEIKEEIDSVFELNQTSSSEIFFKITHIKQAIKNSNKSSAPGPDQISVELVQNGGEQLFHCLIHLMHASYFLGYFPKPWKKENQIYLKKT